jgi:hypothetical protein
VTSLSGFREHVGMDFVWGSRGVSFERHGMESELLVLLFLKVKALRLDLFMDGKWVMGYVQMGWSRVWAM